MQIETPLLPNKTSFALEFVFAMVVSKRCKICAVLDTANVPISGEYFGKQLPEIIFKISGVEIDPRKANDVLICQACVIQLVHTEVVIEKLRNAVQRLKKNVKEAKLKTPAKKTASENAEEQDIKNDGNRTSKDGTVTENNVLNTPKKIVRRRKSTFPDEKLLDVVDGAKQNGETSISGEILVKKTPTAKRKSVSSTTENDKNLSLAIASDDKTTVKRSKTISTSQESPMDLTIDEQDCNNTTGVCVEQIKEKSRNCILCGKTFHSKSTLRDHIETAHMGERLKACPHCSSEFRSQQKYESHVFSEKCKSSNHVCQHPNCSKRFKTVHKMELHMQQKHSSLQESECE